MRSPNYTKCAVICHGLSELQIVRYIKSNLHLKLEHFAKDNGHSSIQITSLMSFLNGKPFKNLIKFSDSYGIEYYKKKLLNFKLFIIMDTDDCTEEQKEKFENKEMFQGHLLYDYIVPIINVPELESVMIKAGIMIKRIKDKDKGDYYFKTFPINNEPLSLNSYLEIETLRDKLKRVKNTNLDIFLDYCLGLVDKPA